MKKYFKYIFLLVLISISFLFYFFHFDQYVTIENLKYYQFLLKDQVTAAYPLAVALYMMFYATSVFLSLPFGGVFTLTGGYLFGVIPTVIYVTISATCGAVGAFLLARYVFGDFLRRRYPYYTKKLAQELTRYGWSYMLSIRLNAAIPFFITNMIIGLTPLSLKTFIWTTALGMIPSITLFAFAGSRLALITSIRDIVTPRVLLAFGALALVPLISMLVRRRSSS